MLAAGCLNPFVFRAELLPYLCVYLHSFNGLQGAFWGNCIRLGVVFKMVTPKAKYGFLADMQPLAKVERRKEWGEVSFEFPLANDAA